MPSWHARARSSPFGDTRFRATRLAIVPWRSTHTNSFMYQGLAYSWGVGGSIHIALVAVLRPLGAFAPLVFGVDRPSGLKAGMLPSRIRASARTNSGCLLDPLKVI